MANWPRRVDFRLSDSATEELELLVDNAADLDKIIEVASRQSPKVSFEDILSNIAKETGKPIDKLRTIFNSLENIKDIQGDLKGIDATLDRLKKVSKKEIADKIGNNAELIKGAVRLYGTDNPVTITIKAQRLTYYRERLLHDAEIISDVRPIFNHAGTEIIELIVTHTLAVTTIEDGRYHRNFMSLDNADILNLRNACNRAITKSRTLKESLGSTWSTEIIRDDAL